ncbi:hypothetical protein FIBSPDRAFT_955396 [Athelia psychrophila]|uniref:Uncharacterized protein n=1 Tax=Athelia psychrophila TaxID=1759441 RepID=A0A166I3V7_9AGAM|nr:hypothetical protein FIBSPDRAFT_955396 [Fibularhizoctonia sp. CBS 109695]
MLKDPPPTRSQDLVLLLTPIAPDSKKLSRPVHKDRIHSKDFSPRQRTRPSPNTIKEKANKHAAGLRNDAKAVPDPVPDTGGDAASVKASKLSSPTGSTLYVLPPVSQVISVLQSTASHTPAPTSSYVATASPATTQSTQSAVPSASSTSTSTATTNDAAASKPAQQALDFASPTVIALMAVGAACALIGVVIVVKVCRRPKRRVHAVPSNPIPQEDYGSDKFANDESPLFGGMERFSAAHGVPWTQYQSGIPKGATDTAVTETFLSLAASYFPSDDEKEQYPAAPLAALTAHKTALHPIQSAVNRATARLSAASMSVYPASPREDIGVALEGSYESEIRPILPRSKAAPKKRSSTMTMAGNNRESRYSQGLAYNGFAISSPNLLSTAQSLPKIAVLPPSSSGGRARVKSSYYAPGAYPRASNMEAEAVSRLDQAYPFDSAQDNLHTMAKSVMRRDRDTQALAFALGFSSPIPPSPQPTLYPDDSLSMVGGYTGNKRSSARVQPGVPVPRHQLDTPPVDASATFGSLMLVDFGSGLPSLKNVREGLADEDARRMSNSHVKRTDDRPPRVPSPPPLPSLSQMGLEHANPEAYANYRSPTYSIYGLYNEADRKSKATSFGF